MRIGELAAATDVHSETIRYYERTGLLPQPPRMANNYRSYSETHRQRLQFIRRVRGLGFPLEEIRALLAMIDQGEHTCADVKSLADRHRHPIQAKIADLRRLDRALSELVSGCPGDERPNCGLIEALWSP